MNRDFFSVKGLKVSLSKSASKDDNTVVDRVIHRFRPHFIKKDLII